VIAAAAQERQKAAAHRDRVAELDRQIGTTDHRCQQLREQIRQADSTAELHSRLATRRAELLTFEPELDSTFVEAQAAVVEAQAAKDALPHLEALSRHRDQHRQATKDARQAAGVEVEQAGQIERLIGAETEARQAAEAAANRQADAERAVAIADDRLAEATRRRAEFSVLAGSARCSVCGQEIGPEHAAREQANLEQAVREAEAQAAQCQRIRTTSSDAVTAARTLREQRETERRAAEAVRDEATRTRKQAERKASEARTGFDTALADLSEDFQRRVPGIDVDGFPTAADLNDLRRLRAGLPGQTRERDRLGKRQRDRDACAGDLATLEQAVRAVGAPSDVTAARAELSQGEQALRDLALERTQVDQARRDAEKAERDWGAQLTRLAGEITELSTQLGRAESAATAVRLRLSEAVEAVPEPYQSDVSVAITPLAEELEQLEASSAERDFAAMAEDRTLHADRTRQLVEAEQQIARVPPGAQRPAAEVLPEVTAAERALQTADGARTAAADELATLIRHQTDRKETEQRLATEERNHTLHDRLAGLLGDRGIQLDLVRDAEGRIIELANDVLVRLSVGDLRFDPPDPTSERSFDLTVRRAGCPGPIAVANLSGGQRFRVAVSLALAVCRFANGERRPLESVIIDEGFGCLDRDGRMAMIAVLRDGQTLSRLFKKVLVVSHQEDFAAAFPVGYRLWSEEGMTKVESFGRC
jgi:DNA repair exonuclease SbcCD ATPase subunit